MVCCSGTAAVVEPSLIPVGMEKQAARRVPVKAWRKEWKEELRKQCLLRVDQERHKLLWRIRSAGKLSEAAKEAEALAFSEILGDEMTKVKMAAEARNFLSEIEDMPDQLWDYETSQVVSAFNQEEYEELMIAMENILYENFDDEDRRREVYLLEDYENVSLLEDESLATSFEHLQTSEENGLLCPFCRTRYLQQNPRHIYCGCGEFKLDIQNDQLCICSKADECCMKSVISTCGVKDGFAVSSEPTVRGGGAASGFRM